VERGLGATNSDRHPQQDGMDKRGEGSRDWEQEGAVLHLRDERGGDVSYIRYRTVYRSFHRKNMVTTAVV
jgi:hypothetical protein